ncbi:DUF3014 domain-containing protein [Spongiibacter nanhainus]|uniref:DUF3014 domain-containing protein n=1 Tax=Spongiibacter nanhainus TaxID=2794344 RepID=A0A7T4QYR8_9GAMM|nr:DUF3014 domain-containing protein [Spongiibacter nanhainus]QQD17176.1 DUF3014 domain-containing protein [Spongiibacter nanhainus]
MNWKAIVAVIALAGVASFVWYVVDQSAGSDFNRQLTPADSSAEDGSDDRPRKTVKETLAVESEEDYQEKAKKAIEPPDSIAGSDDQVRAAAGDLSEPLGSYLSPDEQVRKWVSLIDQMAEYRLPSKHLPVVYNKDSFQVIKNDSGQLVNDPANFDRWDPLINAVTSLDPKNLAVYYKKWSPFLEKAYNELGNPQSFDTQLRSTIEHLLVVEPIPDDTPLKQPKVFYEYADPVLENADPLSKWMWRLGQENMLALQEWLRQLRSYL